MPTTHIDCSVVKTAEIIGEWWSLLILRNAFHGMRTFDAFQRQLDISSSVLSARLKKLTEAGVLQKVPSAADGRSFEDRLTPAGMELYPIIIGLMQWGEKWRPNSKGDRMLLLEKASGQPIRGAEVLSADNRPLKAWEVEVQAGPGADDYVRQLVGEA